jgi:hypothetical protein
MLHPVHPTSQPQQRLDGMIINVNDRISSMVQIGEIHGNRLRVKRRRRRRKRRRESIGCVSRGMNFVMNKNQEIWEPAIFATKIVALGCLEKIHRCTQNVSMDMKFAMTASDNVQVVKMQINLSIQGDINASTARNTFILSINIGPANLVGIIFILGFPIVRALVVGE